MDEIGTPRQGAHDAGSVNMWRGQTVYFFIVLIFLLSINDYDQIYNKYIILIIFWYVHPVCPSLLLKKYL